MRMLKCCTFLFILSFTALLYAQAAPQPLRLWPKDAPLSIGHEALDIPTITPYLPQSNPTRTAVLIAPGGGYGTLSLQKEGGTIGEWFAARGVAAFVLKYRVGHRYHYPAPMLDAKRAIRTIRADAAKYDIDPDHIGMIGFSAGGHLAATSATQPDDGNPSAPDPIDRQSSRLDFLILAYPVISFRLPFGHIASANNLLGPNPDPKLMESLSAETRVTDSTPPTFIFATEDDGTVNVMNSVLFYQALVMHNVSAEIHIYRHGPHGSGLAAGFPLLKGWPDVMAAWMAGNHWMTKESARIITTP